MPVDCSAGVGQQVADVNLLNSKLAYDFAAQLQGQSLIDNQVNARALQALQVRAAEDSQTIKYLSTVGLLQISQTGATENQNLTKPTPNVVADDNATVASGAISSATAQATLGNVTAQLATLTTQVSVLAEALTAFLAQTVANLGSAGAKQTS